MKTHIENVQKFSMVLKNKDQVIITPVIEAVIVFKSVTGTPGGSSQSLMLTKKILN